MNSFQKIRENFKKADPKKLVSPTALKGFKEKIIAIYMAETLGKGQEPLFRANRRGDHFSRNMSDETWKMGGLAAAAYLTIVGSALYVHGTDIKVDSIKNAVELTLPAFRLMADTAKAITESNLDATPFLIGEALLQTGLALAGYKTVDILKDLTQNGKPKINSGRPQKPTVVEQGIEP